MITLNFNISNDGSSESLADNQDGLLSSDNLPSPMQMEGSISSGISNMPSPENILDSALDASLEELAPKPEHFGGSLTESNVSAPAPQMDEALSATSGENDGPVPMDLEDLDSKSSAAKPKARASKSKPTSK